MSEVPVPGRGTPARERTDECAVEESGDDATDCAGDDRGGTPAEGDGSDDQTEDAADQNPHEDAGGQPSLQARFEPLVELVTLWHQESTAEGPGPPARRSERARTVRRC